MKTSFNHTDFENINITPMDESNFYKWLIKNGNRWGKYRGKKYQYYNLYILAVTEYLKKLGFNKEVHFLSEDLITALRFIHSHFYYNNFAQKRNK